MERRADTGIPIPGANAQSYNSYSPVRERLERGTIVHDWIPEDTRTLNKLVRMIYLTDPVAGPAIDFYREVPFGPVALGGMRDEKRLQFNNDAIDALHLDRYLSYLAGDILVDGRLIVHLLLNESKGIFSDLIIHDSDFVEVTHSPIQGEDPIIDLLVPDDYRVWATSPDPRIRQQREKLDPRLIKLMAAGATIPLSPENTIFVPRKMSANDHTGTSLIMRVLPIIAVEWAYLAAETTGLRRRAAPWTIATVGIEDKWEPTPDEMLAIQDMLVAAEEDPVGAKLIFRNGVQISQEGGPDDHAKWLEHWSTLKEAKLQGLGMNEAFATGEASWSYLESMLSLGMERIRNFRSFIAREVIQNGILTPLAKLHGFYKTTPAEIAHRIRYDRADAELDIPTVEWGRSLQPTADRDYLDILQMLEEKGVPITLRKWAQAGGYDLEEGLSSMDSDIELRKNLQDYKQKLKAISLDSGADEEEEMGRWGSDYLADRLSQLPLWDANGEFLDLRKSDLPKLTHCLPKINGSPLGLKAWKKTQAKLRTAGIRPSQQEAFGFLLRRARVAHAPVSKEVIVRVRDQLLRRNGNRVPDRALMHEIMFLNRELESRRVEDPAKIVPNVLANSVTAPWVRPSTPKLLTGEGYEAD